MKAKGYRLIAFLGAALLLFALCQTAVAEPPEIPGNPGVPGLLAQISELKQVIAEQNSSIIDLQEQIAELQALLDAFQNYAPVAQTGQTICYNEYRQEIPCEGTGQDGDYQMGVPWPNPRFIDNNDDTVTDKLTGLMWTKDIEAIPGILGFFDALAACNDLVLGGHDDWRMPNIKELLSLIAYTTQFLPAGHPFLNEPNDKWFWSSTPLYKPQGELYSWGLNANRALSMGREGTLFRVWPVRNAN
jgi:Protein of unknown function (DUF1566)